MSRNLPNLLSEASAREIVLGKMAAKFEHGFIYLWNKRNITIS